MSDIRKTKENKMSNQTIDQLDKLCDELLYYKQRSEVQAHKIIIIQRELSASKKLMKDDQIIKGIHLCESIINREFDDRYAIKKQAMPKSFTL